MCAHVHAKNPSRELVYAFPRNREFPFHAPHIKVVVFFAPRQTDLFVFHVRPNFRMARNTRQLLYMCVLPPALASLLECLAGESVQLAYLETVVISRLPAAFAMSER